MGEPIVSISEGKIKGIFGKNFNGKTICKFLGVPYGKPPVGDLRFKAPQPIDSWTGIKDATKDGDACYNVDVLMDDSKEIVGGEDCLVLNVFTQNIKPAENLKPVMVYIHGGGFTTGSNNSAVYGPEYLLLEDVVLVVINYRLGLLGFLSLEDESLGIPGNAGLKDQVLALKWVQRNIKQFGGDANNVTIFGESAGGTAVHLHMLSPCSKGLFHKAILQSGNALMPGAITVPNGSLTAEALGEKGATDQEVYDTLKNMNGREIFEVQGRIFDPAIFATKRPITAVIEKANPTAFITEQPIKQIKNGDYNHVPMLIGYTSHEGILFEFVKRRSPDISNQYTYELAIPWFLNLNDDQRKKSVELMSSLYSKLKEPHNKDMLVMDSIFFSEAVATIINHRKTSNYPVYVYRASADCNLNFLKQIGGLRKFKGTAHVDELGFLFSSQRLPEVEKNSLEHLTLQRFVKLWTNFAKYGDPTPNKDFGVTLPPVQDDNSIPIIDIGNDLTVFEDLPERDRLELWKNIFNLSDNDVKYFN